MEITKWKIAGTSVIGLSHISNGIGCQDKIKHSENLSTTTLCIADGAGSAKFADIGAEITCNQINDYIGKYFDAIYSMPDEIAIKKIVHSIRTRIGIYAKRNSSEIKDFASTLIFVSVNKGRYVAGHIGDGLLGFLKNNQIEIMSLPENGEFVNETYFVTSKSYLKKFRLYKGKIENITGFILMTDGTCESFFDKSKLILAPIVNILFEWLETYPAEEVNQALQENFEQVIRKKTTDDCSIGIMKLCKHSFIVSENQLI